MTRLLFSCALCAGWALTAQAQGLSTWIQELAALRTLEQTVRQGYTTITTGLGSIGNIRMDEYQLHQDYYGSLEMVSPAVSGNSKTEELTALLQQLVRRLNAELIYWRAQTPIDQP